MSKHRYALAVDIGGTTTKLGVVRDDGLMLATHTVSAPRNVQEYSILNNQIHNLTDSVKAQIDCLGLSVAGLYDETRKILTYHPNNPGLEGADFYTPLTAGFEHLPCAVERDINAGTLGEYCFGTGKSSQRFLCIVLGTGVGAGMVVAGELLRLAYDGIGDPGYVVVKPDGIICPGGSRGCLEAEVSSDGIIHRTLQALVADKTGSILHQRKAELTPGNARAIIEAAASGDELAQAVMYETGNLLGLGLSSLASIFAPDCIAIAGGVTEDCGALLLGAQESFKQYTAPFYAECVEIKLAQLGAWANVVGIAAAGFELMVNKF